MSLRILVYSLFLAVSLHPLLIFADPLPQQTDCDLPVRQPESFQVTPDDEFNTLWMLREGGWTGGDGGFSIPLPDGRVLWTFGDSFLGTVDETDTRQQEGFVMIRNTVVVQDGTTMTTLRGGTPESPEGFVTPTQPDSWYWPFDGWVQGDQVLLVWQRFTSPSGDAWDLQYQSTDVQTLSLPDLTPVAMTSLNDRTNGGQLRWGVEFLQTESHIYIYGIADMPLGNFLSAARYPVDGDFFGAWEYFDGEAWVGDPAASAPLLSVSNSLGVVATETGYALITFTPAPFSSQLVVYEACDPVGPWSEGTVVYAAPEADDKRIVYFPLAHPQFADESGMLVSYSVNAHNFDDLCPIFACHLEPGGASNYRPRFLRIVLN